MKNTRYLMEPIWELYHIDSYEDFQINNVSFNSKIADYLKKQYALDRRRNIYRSLEWAENNSTFNFKSVMDKAPVAGELPFSNEEIYSYLMQFKSFMENETFSLLSDNSPPEEI